MSNYRFENILPDLRDCAEPINDGDLDRTEEQYRKALIKMCVRICEESGYEVREL